MDHSKCSETFHQDTSYFKLDQKGGKMFQPKEFKSSFNTEILLMLIAQNLFCFQLREVEGVLETEAECMKREIISPCPFCPESVD